MFLGLVLSVILPCTPSLPSATTMRADSAPRPRSTAFDPPAILVPVSGFATYVPGADVKEVEYIALDGEEPFPVSLIGGDPKAFLFLTRGLPDKDYRFIGVASDSSGRLTRKAFIVRVGAGGIKDPPVKKDPPVVTPTENLFFLIVRPDGPATAHFTKIMQDPAWITLKASGHKVKDYTVSVASQLGYTVPSDVPLPAVITLAEGEKTSRTVRGAIALPTTATAILDLQKVDLSKGVK